MKQKSMKDIFKLKVDKNRMFVMETIRQRLYPIDEFPENLFPGLPSILYKCFIEAIGSRGELRDSYRDSNDKDKIETLVCDILSFKNLLHNYPHTVALMYFDYIKKFIRYKTGSQFKSRDWEDIFQEVITRLISDKIHRIRDRFDFDYKDNNFSKKSFFTSYLMVCVRNIYMDIILERNVRPLTAGHIQPIDDAIEIYDKKDDNMLSRLAIAEEFQKLHTILSLYYRGRPKLELCLKLKCRIPLSKEDIIRCFPKCDSPDIQLLAGDFKNMKDKMIFDKVVPVFNRLEGVENKSDSLRKWVSIKVDEITSHLNRTHPVHVYTSKNFIDFITLYFERHHLTGSHGVNHFSDGGA
jgi:DNA-directed RNA polymerase specialized sigma24 family protein